MSNSKTLIELAAERRAILNCFEGDDITNDEEKMRRLGVVEGFIVSTNFETDVDRLSGLGILLDMNEMPKNLDNFKQALFLKMQRE